MLVSLFLAAVISAPPAEITGKTTVEQYKLVQLNVANIDDETAVLWDVYPEEQADIREFSDGSLIFTGPPGKYKIKLRLINGKNVQTFRTEVTINGKPVNPTPPVNPDTPVNPDNPVDPVLPDGNFRLAAKAKAWVDSVNSANRTSEAQNLGAAFDSMVAAINAGTVATVDDLMKLSRDTNRQLLGTSATAWQPWFSNLKQELDTLYDAKLLTDLNSYKTAFSEIAIGLRSIK
jgi:hypothetical protein